MFTEVLEWHETIDSAPKDRPIFIKARCGNVYFALWDAKFEMFGITDGRGGFAGHLPENLVAWAQMPKGRATVQSVLGK